MVALCANFAAETRKNIITIMAIKYEIQMIRNSGGSGIERRFARIFESEPMTAEQMENFIQDNCSLTRSDVRSALVALRDCMLHELRSGNRFHLPGIGYFALSVDLDMPESLPNEKARADYITLRSVKFRPERSLVEKVGRGMRFERAHFSTQSRKCSEEDVIAGLYIFFETHSFLTRRCMELEFGLRPSTAQRWLRRLVENGVLRKEGARNSPIYFLDSGKAVTLPANKK